MNKTTHVFIPCLAVCALLAGCGKQSEEAIAEKLIEKSLSRDGVAAKVDLDGGTMKFTTTDAQGRKADFKVEGDTVQVVSEDGAAAFSSGAKTHIPDTFPKDVLLYPGARPDSSMTSAESTMVSFKTPDDVGKVGQRYKDDMAAAGWKETSAFTSEESWMLTFAKETRRASVFVNKDEAGAMIMITLDNRPVAQ